MKILPSAGNALDGTNLRGHWVKIVRSKIRTTPVARVWPLPPSLPRAPRLEIRFERD